MGSKGGTHTQPRKMLCCQQYLPKVYCELRQLMQQSSFVATYNITSLFFKADIDKRVVLILHNREITALGQSKIQIVYIFTKEGKEYYTWNSSRLYMHVLKVEDSSRYTLVVSRQDLFLTRVDTICEQPTKKRSRKMHFCIVRGQSQDKPQRQKRCQRHH